MSFFSVGIRLRLASRVKNSLKSTFNLAIAHPTSARPEQHRLFYQTGAGSFRISELRAFKREAGRMGLRPELTLHSFRHTFAKRALESGMSLTALASLMGHTDAYVTQVYKHFTIEDMAAALRKKENYERRKRRSKQGA